MGEIDAGPAETLQDPAVKLRRLGAYVEGPRPMRLLEGALEAVERAAGEPLPGVSRNQQRTVGDLAGALSAVE